MVENRYTPDEVSPPGETLLELLEERGMTQAELAERTGRPRKTINELVKGKAAITPATALQLERTLGVPATFWNTREQHYRDYLARREERRRLTSRVSWIDRFPVKELVRGGWIADRRGDKVGMVEELLAFFGIASPDQWQAVWQGVAFRKAKKSNVYALSAWLRCGQIVAERATCAAYDEARFRQALEWIRTLTSLPPGELQSRLEQTCARCGVVIAFVKELTGSGASGATFWIGGRAVIQLSLRYKTDDHLWFTFFHEAGHILLHSRRETFIEGLDDEDRREEEANRFAAEILIPTARLQAWATGRRHWSHAAIQAFATELAIAPGIVVGRLQHDGLLPRTHCNGLKRRLDWAR